MQFTDRNLTQRPRPVLFPHVAKNFFNAFVHGHSSLPPRKFSTLTFTGKCQCTLLDRNETIKIRCTIEHEIDEIFVHIHLILSEYTHYVTTCSTLPSSTAILSSTPILSPTLIDWP